MHWRQIDFAESLLSLLLRRDCDLPESVVLHFFNLLVSESIKTRKIAIAFCGSWLKIHRQKAVKTICPIPNQPPNSGPGAKWPIKFGVREDNEFLLYDAKKTPADANEWDNCKFHAKVHLGYYTWPAEFKSYAPPIEQDWANRNFSDLTPMEQSIVSVFKDSNFMDKFLNFYSLEEKKGSEQFDPVNSSLFYRIFRGFNDILLQEFIAMLDKLLNIAHESHHRLASELVTGLVCGSKLWRHAKVRKVQEGLEKRLTDTFLELTPEVEKNWGTALATIFDSCEPRTIAWLVELLFRLARRPTEISTQITTRLYLLQSGLEKFGWRTPNEWRQLTELCLKQISGLGGLYQNVRLCIGSCLATSVASDADDTDIYSKYNYVTVKEVISRINSLLEPLWKESQKEVGFFSGLWAKIGHFFFGCLELSTKKEKVAMITLLDFMGMRTRERLFQTMDESVIDLIPLLAHYSNDNSDELKRKSTIQLLLTGLSVTTTKEDLETLLVTCTTLCKKAKWWRSKICLLRFLQVFTFTNQYVITAQPGGFSRLQQLIMDLLCDCRFEVRVAAAETFGGLIRAAIFTVDGSFLDTSRRMASSTDLTIRHSGVLALSAVVLAFPYSVPDFLPEVLMAPARHSKEPQPIYGTVKRALNEFKRTHQDEWHTHKLTFTEDQLLILRDVMISPSYYV